MKKMLDGKLVDMTAAEIAQFEAGRNAAAQVFGTLDKARFDIGLLILGVTEQMVEDAITALSVTEFEKNVLRIKFRKGARFDRHAPDVMAIQQIMGKTDASVDEAWRQASKL
jgi:hypothetical protein